MSHEKHESPAIPPSSQTELEDFEGISIETQAKAKSFFRHAAHARETGGWTMAMQSMLNGIKLVPGSITHLQTFLDTAESWRVANPDVNTPPKAIRSEFKAKKTDIDGYIYALLHFAVAPSEPNRIVSLIQAAKLLDMPPIGRFLADLTLPSIESGSDIRPAHCDALLAVLNDMETIDLAIRVAQVALRLDPQNTERYSVLKELQAEQYMSSKSDSAKATGDFRDNIRDADAQAILRASDELVTRDHERRSLIDDAKAKWQDQPDDKDAINKYVKTLLDRGSIEDEETAWQILSDAHEATQDFSFREAAGDIRIQRSKRQENAARQQLMADPSNLTLQENFTKRLSQLLAVRHSEYRSRTEKYGRSNAHGMRLGRLLYDIASSDDLLTYYNAASESAATQSSMLNDAIEVLQDVAENPKEHALAMLYLGHAFRLQKWFDEAIVAYRMSQQSTSQLPEKLQREPRFGLILALLDKAESQNDGTAATEARQLVAEAVVERINYRRDELLAARQRLLAFSSEAAA